MTNWVNLHNHSAFSMLDGHGQVDAYMSRAAEMGMPALAVTDHGNLHAWLDFYEAGKKHGVKPILGIEAYQARKTRFDQDDEERAGPANDEFAQRGPYHLTILAKNIVGYKNLIKLSSRAFTEGFYVKPRIDHELIAEHADGLIVLSGCLNGEVAQALMSGSMDEDSFRVALESAGRMQDIVGKENYFIEIMDHAIEEERMVLPDLLRIAEKIGAPVVPSGDCHYVGKTDSQAHDLMLCVSTNSLVEEEDRFKFRPEEFHLKSYEEMRERFEPEWLANTLDVADMVDLDLSFNEFHFPDFPIPEEETVDSYLEKKVWAGIRERYGDDFSDEVRDRVNYELRVVKESGFQGYFLVVSDLTRQARDTGVRTGWGRGSAAGSILSYALRITNLDPLRFGLMFERFLVEGRKSPPDIDLDFDDTRREEVINYAREKYGDNRVAHIGTFSRVKARQAIRDAARVMGYEYSAGNEVAKLVPPPRLGVDKSLDESLETPDMRRAYESKEDTRKIIDAAKGLEGLVRQSSIHAAGVVIAKSEITNYVPVMQKPKQGKPGPLVTQWDMNRVEQCGQLKVDFLGLRNLNVIDVCLANIREHRGIEVDVEAIPLDDPLTYQKLCEGYSMGVFQLESSGMRQMMMSLQPSSIEDIMALVSLYRPGPLGSKIDKLFIARKHGKQEATAEHPILQDLLSSTYGVMLYQEDVLAVARNLAGFTAAEADDLRKAIGKKQMDKIGLFREKFVEGCRKTHNVDTKLANKIYSDIEYFGGYGFNLAHAASYAMVSYVTAYLKFHYPAEYMAALLTSVDDKEKAGPYLNECRNLEIQVLPPSINRSNAEFKVESDNEILFGLSSIAGIGPAVVSSILESRTEQPYTSIYDFMRRCNTDVLNKGTLEHLFSSGAMDELVPEQPERVMPRSEKMSVLDAERDELGLYITSHPLVGVWHGIESRVTSTIADLQEVPDGEHVVVGGIISKAQRRTTKRGDTMYILTFEDITDSVEVVVFPQAVGDNVFEEGDIVLIDGRVGHDGDEHITSKIIFTKMSKPEISQFGSGKPIVIKLTEKPDYDTVKRMRDLIHQHPGDCPVYLSYNESNDTQVSLKFKRPAHSKIRDDLQLLGKMQLRSTQ